ncbi:MAG TPA: cytochrome c oxidase subunit II [Chloroflexota bacterium]|nr:cytochrome c oxidase subunit II [Chloroflexota bacterium]
MEINVHRFVLAASRGRKLSDWLSHTPMSWCRIAIGAILGLAGALAVAGVALAEPRSPFSPASPQAQQIENLFIFVLVIAGLIFLGVEGTLIYSSFAFRAREGRQPSTTSGNTRLEIAWTVTPAVLLAIVFILTVRTMHSITAVPSDPLVIRVVAHQFWWEFDYPNANIVTANELHVPVGEQVIINLESADVIHSFWVPQLAGKSDANPGHVNQVTFTATQPGVYGGQCSEFCGVGHAWMLIRVVAETPADYNAWIAAQRQPAVAPTGGLAAQGQQLFQSEACGSCHSINGTSANGVAGPNLTHVASRATIGAGVVENTPANMDRWLTNPQAVKPGVLMPNFKLTPDQVKALTAYMETLR